MCDYNVIVGVYNGVGNLSRILDAVNGQSVKPKDVYVWANGGKFVELRDICHAHGADLVKSQHNFGCYSRFLLAFMFDTKYTMVLDDDTVPGRFWAANCIATMDAVGPAVVGDRGVRLGGPHYDKHKSFGTVNRNLEPEEVDLVGHAWFFPTRFVRNMFKRRPVNPMNGEDIQLSALVQGIGYPTYVAPHPKDPDMWGSTQRHLGGGRGRISTMRGLRSHFEARSRCVRYWIEHGWRPMFMRKKLGGGQ